jgi:hypothetical protein
MTPTPSPTTPASSGGGGGGGGVSTARPAPTANIPSAVSVGTGGGGGGGGGGGQTTTVAVVPGGVPTPQTVPVSALPLAVAVLTNSQSGVSGPVSDTGVIPLQVSDAPDSSDVASLQVDPSLFSVIPNALQLRIVADDQPTLDSNAGPQAFGGGAAAPLASPLSIQVLTVERDSGQMVPAPDSVASLSIAVELPPPPVVSSPGQESTWLMELDDASGAFVGYVRPANTIDPVSQQIRITVPIAQLQHGTLFVPVLLSTAYVRNFDAGVHIWSGPLPDAVDFGPAAPQWTRMQVTGPQVGQRLPVVKRVHRRTRLG